MHLRPEPANCSSLVMQPSIWIGLQGLISNFVETFNFQALLVMKSAWKKPSFSGYLLTGCHDLCFRLITIYYKITQTQLCPCSCCCNLNSRKLPQQLKNCVTQVRKRCTIWIQTTNCDLSTAYDRQQHRVRRGLVNTVTNCNLTN